MSLMKFSVFLSDKGVWTKFQKQEERQGSKWAIQMGIAVPRKTRFRGMRVAQRSSQYVADGFRAATVIALISIY